MPSIHKDPRGKSQFWYCAFTLPDGRRVLRSTKEADRQTARSVCEKWARLSQVLAETPKLVNTELVLENFIYATRQAAKGEFTEATARKMLDEILRAGGQRQIQTSTIRGHLSGWLATKEVSKAKGTARRYRDVVDPFLAALGTRAEADLAALTPRDIEAFRDSELRAGKSNKTANFAVKTLRIALNAARRQALILTNPAEAVDNLPEHSAERGAFTSGDIRKILAVADAEWFGMTLLGASAGLRIGDASRLTWGNIDLSRMVISLNPQKTGTRTRKKLEIPILRDLEDYLTAIPSQSHYPEDPLFPKLSKKKTTGANGLSNTFTRLIQESGISNEAASEPVHGKGRMVFRFGFHALRHTFVSMMANAGVSKELRMKLAGHTSNVHDRYTHHELTAVRRALDNFPQFSTERQSEDERA